MVSDHSESDGLFEGIGFLAGVDVDVFFAAKFFEYTKNWLEDIGGVVCGFLRKVSEVLGVLNE